MSAAFPSRPLPADQADEAGGMMGVWLGDDEAMNASDQAFAGLLLAKRGDQESLPTIERLAATAADADKAVLSRAVELLVHSKP